MGQPRQLDQSFMERYKRTSAQMLHLNTKTFQSDSNVFHVYSWQMGAKNSAVSMEVVLSRDVSKVDFTPKTGTEQILFICVKYSIRVVGKLVIVR